MGPCPQCGYRPTIHVDASEAAVRLERVRGRVAALIRKWEVVMPKIPLHVEIESDSQPINIEREVRRALSLWLGPENVTVTLEAGTVIQGTG
jgi:hypothetical protein